MNSQKASIILFSQIVHQLTSLTVQQLGEGNRAAVLATYVSQTDEVLTLF